MSLFLDTLQDSALSHFLSSNPVAFPTLEVLHVLAISLVLGTVFLFDVRLVGAGWKDWPARRLQAQLLPLTLGGFGAAAITGGLLFLSQPAIYAVTTPFLIKLGLLGAAGLNAGVFHWWLARLLPDGAGQGGLALPLPLAVRLSAGLSLVLWSGVLIAGRIIGFVVIH